MNQLQGLFSGARLRWIAAAVVVFNGFFRPYGFC